MDVFIPFGGKQNFDGLELRYTLRSLEKHMSDLGTVFVAGIIPDWLRNVEYLAIPDIPGNPTASTQAKLLEACRTERLSPDFLFTHDDIFALEDFSGETLPFYSTDQGTGSLASQKNFAVHFPVRYNKEMYLKLMESQDISGILSPRSFFLNFYGAPATKISECVVRAAEPVEAIEAQLFGSPFCTVNDRSFSHPTFCEFMDKRFPTPSRFEVV